MSILRTIFSVLLIALIALGGLALVMALVLAWTLLWASLLRSLIAFSLFESAALTLGATYLAYRIVEWLLDRPSQDSPTLITDEFDDEDYDDDYDDDDDDDEEDSAYPISAERFTRAPNGSTWEAWARYVIANNICLALSAEPDVANYLNERQRQEVSIRLADVVVPVLQRAKSGSGQPRVSIAGLKHQMDNMNMQPYEDELLLTAVRVVNLGLQAEPQLKRVVQLKLWSEQCDKPDW